MTNKSELSDLGGKQPSGNPPGQPKGANNQARRQNNSQKGKPRTRNSSTGFCGDTEKMKGFVFELPLRDSQMTDTLDMLKCYVCTTYTSAPAMGTLFLQVPTAPTVKKLASKLVPMGEPVTKGSPPTLTDFDTELFKEHIQSYGKKVELLERELISFFSVIFGQCGHTLCAELCSLAGFAEAELKGDCLWILAAICSALTKFDKGNYVHKAIHDLWSCFYKEHQGTQSTIDYFNNFETLIKTLQENSVIRAPLLTQDPDPDVVRSSDEETRCNLRERSLAVALIKNSDNCCFGQLKDNLKTNYARGMDQWPKTLVAAYNLLVAHECHEAAKTKVAKVTGTLVPTDQKGISLQWQVLLHFCRDAFCLTASPVKASSTTSPCCPTCARAFLPSPSTQMVGPARPTNTETTMGWELPSLSGQIRDHLQTFWPSATCIASHV